MRITRELLHKFASETVRQRQRTEPDLHAAYISGSLLLESPLVGGTTDIDLVLVHKFHAPVKRETIGLTREVSLDIFHEVQDRYTDHRKLRQDPWIGYPLTNTQIVLFDTDYWFEFIQASVRANFHNPENVLARVNIFLSGAREHWFQLSQQAPQGHLEWLNEYLEVLSHAANAISGLVNSPLSTRRFLIDFRNNCELLGESQLFTGFTSLLGSSVSHVESIPAWIDLFEADFNIGSKESTASPHLAACRQAYYVDALRAFISGDEPGDATWPLLRTWLDLRLSSPTALTSQKAWDNFIDALQLTEKLSYQKIDALDAFLDTLEVMIEDWAESYGLSNLPDLTGI